MIKCCETCEVFNTPQKHYCKECFSNNGKEFPLVAWHKWKPSKEYAELDRLAEIGRATEKMFSKIGKRYEGKVAVVEYEANGLYYVTEEHVELESVDELLEWAEEDQNG